MSNKTVILGELGEFLASLKDTTMITGKDNTMLIISVGSNDSCIAVPLTLELVEILLKSKAVQRNCSWNGNRSYKYTNDNNIDLHIVKEFNIKPVPVLVDTAQMDAA